jgi:hypothetical protein
MIYKIMYYDGTTKSPDNEFCRHLPSRFLFSALCEHPRQSLNEAEENSCRQGDKRRGANFSGAVYYDLMPILPIY